MLIALTSPSRKHTTAIRISPIFDIYFGRRHLIVRMISSSLKRVMRFLKNSGEQSIFSIQCKWSAVFPHYLFPIPELVSPSIKSTLISHIFKVNFCFGRSTYMFKLLSVMGMCYINMLWTLHYNYMFYCMLIIHVHYMNDLQFDQRLIKKLIFLEEKYCCHFR